MKKKEVAEPDSMKLLASKGSQDIYQVKGIIVIYSSVKHQSKVFLGH